MNKKNSKIFNNLVRQGKDRKDFYKIKKQNQEAFIEVYDRYVNDIYRFVYFKVKRPEEAQDITSAVFLKAWNSLRDKEPDENKVLTAYLYKIARNCVIDHYRQSRTTLSIETEVEENENSFQRELKDEKQNLVKEAELNSDMENVYRKLEELKEEYKEIIILKYVNELTLPEIASITGRTRNNARVRLHRALKALRTLIEEEEKNNINYE